MQLIDIRDINTNEVSVYYRMQYTANAVFEIAEKETAVPISFVIEISPLGEKKIFVKITGSVDYPLMPLLSLLKKRIMQLYEEGVLV